MCIDFVMCSFTLAFPIMMSQPRARVPVACICHRCTIAHHDENGQVAREFDLPDGSAIMDAHFFRDDPRPFFKVFFPQKCISVQVLSPWKNF